MASADELRDNIPSFDNKGGDAPVDISNWSGLANELSLIQSGKEWAAIAIVAVAVVGGAELLLRWFGVPAYIMPTPTQIVAALVKDFPLIAPHIGYTLIETVAGFALGCALAFLLGIAVALSRRIDYYCSPYIIMFQALPKVALAPLILIWFGLGLSSKIVNSALVAFFPLMVNTIAGLRSADEDRVNLMRSLAASKSQIFWMLQLPNALPFIFAGLEVAMIFALIGAIVGEFIGASHGLGMLIQSMTFNNDMAGQFSILFLLSLIGLSLNFIVAFARRRILFWDPSSKSALSANTRAKGDPA